MQVFHLIPTSGFNIVTKFDGKEKRNEQFILKFLMLNIYFRKTVLVTELVSTITHYLCTCAMIRLTG